MPFASISRERGRVARAALVCSLVIGAALPRAQTPAPASAGEAPAQDRFRSKTELVVLQVAVVDGHGKFVPGLREDDFAVYEDGKPQTVTYFAATSPPLDLMLLIDTSASMVGRMALAQDAAIELVRTLKPGDRAGVVLFSHQLRKAHALSGDFAEVESAIKSAEAMGATAVYEALYVTLRDLARARVDPGEQRRSAIVVLSDGEDNRSHVEFLDLLSEARRLTATIFTVLPGPFPDAAIMDATRVKPNAMFEMRAIAEATGGRVFTPATMTDLGRVYQEIASELRHQYWLAYAPQPSPLDGFKRISVRTETHPGLRARTRSGYYVGREARSR